MAVAQVRRVVLFSGGLDSFIGTRLLRHEQPLWKPVYVNLNTGYTHKELDMLRLSSEHFRDIHAAVGELRKVLDVQLLEQSDGFVPQRNVMLCTLAQATYDATEVAMCSVDGEYSRDKHPQFFKRLSGLLTYTAGHPVHVFSPLAGMTKTQAVRRYIEVFGAGRAFELQRYTVSCYDKEAGQCGACMSCFRRWVAFENNGIVDTFRADPWVWIRSQHKPLRTVKQLPVRQWPDFARAQWEVVTAIAKVQRRLRKQLTPVAQ